MLSQAERRAKRKALEDTRRWRIENLRRLAEYAGGIRALSKVLGLNEALLQSMIGQNCTRGIPDTTARWIESALNLAQGRLDQNPRMKLESA